MDDKWNARITVFFLCGILLVFTFADIFNKDRLFSENENRVLASRPSFSWDKVWSGKYSRDYETYVTDQFVGRDTWIGLKTRGDILMQKKDINGIYLGKDGYLFEQHLESDFPQETIDKKLALLAKLTQRYRADVMLAPTADNIISDKLPDNAPYLDQRKLLEKVKEAVGEERVIDVFPLLKKHASQQLYYRTDHHWTTTGAYYGYLSWVWQTDRLAPYIYDPEKLVTVTDSFLGTLHSRVNLPVEPDSIEIFSFTNKMPVSITYDFQKKSDSYYEEKYLDTKNKYGYFLDDNHGIVQIDTGYHSGRELFLIKDSYANCMIPLLAPHYNRITVLDLRYYNGKLFDLIDRWDEESREEGREMDVLVLYNFIHFIEDFQYY